MGQLIGALCLLALAVFIVWDSTAKTKMSRVDMERGVTPGSSAIDMALVALAIVAAVYGIVELMDPSGPPYTWFNGRPMPILSTMHSIFGVWGFPIVSWAMAFMSIAAVIKRRIE